MNDENTLIANAVNFLIVQDSVDGEGCFGKQTDGSKRMSALLFLLYLAQEGSRMGWTPAL